MNTPALLAPGGCPGPQSLRKMALGHFGELVEALASGRQATLEPPGALESGSVAEWRQAIAEELLLFAQTERERATQLGAAFLNELPFRRHNGPTLAQLMDFDAAAAVAPVDTGDPTGQGTWMHLWLVHDPEAKLPPDDRSRLERAEDWLRSLPEHKLFVVTTEGVPEKTRGPSWHLAAELARLALANPAERSALGCDWVVTGDVEQGRDRLAVRYVGFGNKEGLAPLVRGRRWLVPAAWQPELWQGDSHVRFLEDTSGRLYFALDTASAWAQVTGRGLLSGGELTWERLHADGFETVHAFVSNALTPTLGSFLLLRPKHIVLWASKEMKPHAEQLHKACQALQAEGLLPMECKIEPQYDCPAGPVEVERRLRSHPTLQPASREHVVFNSTGGTFQMRVAPHELARLQPNLLIIYRPQTPPEGGGCHERLRFTLLSYPGLQLTERALRVSSDMSVEEADAWFALLDNRLDEPELSVSKRRVPLPVERLADRLVDLALTVKAAKSLPPGRKPSPRAAPQG